jgi:hypothetical protein
MMFTNRARLAPFALVVLSFALTGCQALLPRASSEVRDTWVSFGEARDAIDRIVPYETRRSQLAAQGLEPGKNPAITLLSFADVSQRFALGSTVTADELDRGLRECFAAGKRCTGYSIAIRDVKSRRVGNFWLDAFNFVRVTDSTGWNYNALILFVDDLVVYTLDGGQPRISERDQVRNPLGPLQTWGDILAKRTLD